MLKARHLEEVGTHFREQLLAAPLKPLPAGTVTPIPPTFPRAAARGPIEAMDEPLEYVAPFDFREQLLAAPLKLDTRVVLDDFACISAISCSRPHCSARNQDGP